MPGSKLIELMRQQYTPPLGIELATVITPPPGLIIRIDNMEINLQGDDLIVSEHLWEHTREFSLSASVGGATGLGGSGPHDHSLKTITATKQTITIHSNLKAGDRIAVQALPGGQQYLVLDKVVVVGG